jgi:hypothetical protein
VDYAHSDVKFCVIRVVPHQVFVILRNYGSLPLTVRLFSENRMILRAQIRYFTKSGWSSAHSFNISWNWVGFPHRFVIFHVTLWGGLTHTIISFCVTRMVFPHPVPFHKTGVTCRAQFHNFTKPMIILQKKKNLIEENVPEKVAQISDFETYLQY